MADNPYETPEGAAPEERALSPRFLTYCGAVVAGGAFGMLASAVQGTLPVLPPVWSLSFIAVLVVASLVALVLAARLRSRAALVLLGAMWIGVAAGSIGYLVWLLSLLVMPGLLIFALIRRAKSYWVLLASVAALGGVSFLALRVSAWLSQIALERVAERGAVIVDAIDRFASESEALPEDLHQLVPVYLDAIPSTGAIEYPEFRYRGFEGVYEVRVELAEKPDRFKSCFVYRSDKNYPELKIPERSWRVGDWAYFSVLEGGCPPT